MAMEILDLPMNNGDFRLYVSLIYQRVPPSFIHGPWQVLSSATEELLSARLEAGASAS